MVEFILLAEMYKILKYFPCKFLSPYRRKASISILHVCVTSAA